jgi:hypothetical protein
MLAIVILLLTGSACGAAAVAALVGDAADAALFDIEPDERLLATLAADD